RILLAEVGALGPDDVEELQADGRDPAKVAGPVLALEPSTELLDLDPGLETVRIDLSDVRDEEEVGARRLGHAGVGRLVAWVLVEVLAGPELGRVDEQADDDDVALAAG